MKTLSPRAPPWWTTPTAPSKLSAWWNLCSCQHKLKKISTALGLSRSVFKYRSIPPSPHNIIKFFSFAFTNRPQQLSCHPRCLPPRRLLPPPTMISSPRTMFLPTCSRQKPLKTRLADPDFYHKFVCWFLEKSLSHLNFCFARESTNLKKPARRLRTLRFQIYIFLIENIYSSIS